MYGLTLVAALVFIGGVVAFIGDKVGRRIGRKRLSLFGMRPRHTSIVITVVTGILIAGATLAILAAVSSDVRTALFSMRQLQETLARNQVELAKKDMEIRDKQGLADKLARQIEERTREFEELRGKLDQVQSERAAIEKQLGAVRGELSDVQLSYRKAQADYKQAEADLGSTRGKLDVQLKRVDELRQQGTQLAGKIQSLTLQRKDLEKEIDALQANLNVQLFGNVAYRSGELVASTVLPGGRTPAQVQGDIVSFLMGPANEAAKKRGANYQGRTSVFIIDQNSLDDAVQQIAAKQGKYVVRAISLYNSLVENPVTIQVRAYPNRLLFHKGELIVKEKFGADMPADRLQSEFLLLLGQANEVAIRGGMITSESGVTGQVSWKDTLEAIAKAKGIGGEVEVGVLARDDTWSAVGPLQFQWDVTPSSTK